MLTLTKESRIDKGKDKDVSFPYCPDADLKFITEAAVGAVTNALRVAQDIASTSRAFGSSSSTSGITEHVAAPVSSHCAAEVAVAQLANTINFFLQEVKEYKKEISELREELNKRTRF